MGNEAWPAHWFKKKTIYRPTVKECINELQIYRNNFRHVSNAAIVEHASFTKAIHQYLPEYDTLCHLPETTNNLIQYSETLLQQRLNIVSQVIEGLHMVEVRDHVYQIFSYDQLKIAAPAQAFHVLLLQIIRKNMLCILKQRTDHSKK